MKKLSGWRGLADFLWPLYRIAKLDSISRPPKPCAEIYTEPLREFIVLGSKNCSEACMQPLQAPLRDE